MATPEPAIRAILDTVLDERRFGGTSKRRLKHLVAVQTQAMRWQTAQDVFEYMLARRANPDDPLTREVVVAVNMATAAPARTPAPTRVAKTRGRTRKGRELRRIPPGVRIEYDGVGAEIRAGEIRLDDGQRFDAPSPAARYVTGQESVNGWRAWRVVDDGRSLADYYDDGAFR